MTTLYHPRPERWPRHARLAVTIAMTVAGAIAGTRIAIPFVPITPNHPKLDAIADSFGALPVAGLIVGGITSFAIVELTRWLFRQSRL